MSQEARHQGPIPLEVAFSLWIMTVVAGLVLTASILRNGDEYCPTQDSGPPCGMQSVLVVTGYFLCSFILIALVAEISRRDAPEFRAILVAAMVLGPVAVGVTFWVLLQWEAVWIVVLPLLLWAGVLLSAPIALIQVARRSGERVLNRSGLLLTVVGSLAVGVVVIILTRPP